MIYTGIKGFKELIKDGNVEQKFALHITDHNFQRFYEGHDGNYCVDWTLKKGIITVHAYKMDMQDYELALHTYCAQLMDNKDYPLFIQAAINLCTVIGYGQLEQKVSEDTILFYKKYRELLQYQLSDKLIAG